jgi:hypothetical protein
VGYPTHASAKRPQNYIRHRNGEQGGIIYFSLICKILSLEVADAIDIIAPILMDFQGQIILLTVVVLKNKKALDMLTTAQEGSTLFLGKTAAFGLIDHDKFKLTFINKPTKPLNLENEPTEESCHGKTCGHGYPGFSFLEPSMSTSLLLATGPCFINVLTRFVSSHL